MKRFLILLIVAGFIGHGFATVATNTMQRAIDTRAAQIDAIN